VLSDLEHQRIEIVFLVEQMLQRCVRDDAAIPEMIGPTFTIGSAGGSAPLAVMCSDMACLPTFEALALS
jgi:hypothetical protein